MKKTILLLLVLILFVSHSFSQVTIADWESGGSPTLSCDPQGVNPTRVLNPFPEGANRSSWVQQLTTLSNTNYEVVYTNPMLTSYIDFTDVNAISVKVRSDVTGNVLVKLSNYNNPSVYTLTTGYYYAVNNWQDMKFYLPDAVSGSYNVLAIFPDYEGGARAGTWYIDDIKTYTVSAPFSEDTIVNNDTYFRYFQAWGASDPQVTDNPVDTDNPNNINRSSRCLKFTSTTEAGEGIKHVFESKFDFSSKNTISVMVYSPYNIGIIELRLEGSDVPTKVLKYQYTTPGLWQKLTFDLTGTQTNAYNLLAIVPDYGNTTSGIEWYFDEITFGQETIGTFESYIIADFDNYKRIIENNGGTGGISVTTNPDIYGINPSTNVLQVNTISANQWECFGTTLERNLDFEHYNAFSMMVYSESSERILLKLQGKNATPVEVFKQYNATDPPTWQRLRFDVSAAATNTYNDIQIFPDFGQARDGVWYFDEFKTENISLQGDIITNFDESDNLDFEDWESTGGYSKVPNPYKEAGINTSNTVLKIITVSAQEEGVKTTYNGLDFSNNNSISCKVYSPFNSGIVQLRLEGTGVPVITSNYQYTTPGHWQVLTFDLTEAQANPSGYNLIAIRPDYGGTTPDISWYFDDFTIDNVPITPFNGSILANFEDVPRTMGQHYTNGINYIANPAPGGINPTAKVLDVISSTDLAESVYDARERNLDFSTKNAISISVLSSQIGLVHLKLINGSNTSYPPFHAECQYTDKNQWQKLTFDLRGAPTNVYNIIQVFPGIEDTTSNIHWYLDEFTFETTEFLPYAMDTISNFDGVQKVFRQWDTKGFGITDNPLQKGINLSKNVMRVYTSSSASGEGIKTVLDRNLDFSKAPSNFINVNVFSTVSGSVQLTLEGKCVETRAFILPYSATNPPEWKTLSFNVSGLATDAYNLVALLPDATGSSDNIAWYFDDIAIERNDGLVLYSNWDGIVTGSFTPSGSSASILQVANPVTSGNGINVGGNVLQLANTAANAGVIQNIGRYIDFSTKQEFHIDYYSTIAGSVRMQLEGTGVSANISQEVNYTTPGQWQELTFKFNNAKTDVYNQLSILPNTSGTWYIDNIRGPNFTNIPIVTSTTYADWELISPKRSKVWGGLTDTIELNPLAAGINQTPHALKVTTIADSLWEGFSIDCSEGVLDFSDGRKFVMDVYSTNADTVLLKLENTTVEGIDPVQLFAYYTKPGVWQQLVFSFDSLLLSSFNRMAIFPDINGTGTADWYFDNIQGPRTIDKSLILKAPGGIAEGREDGKSIIVYLFGETFKASPWNPSNFIISGLQSPVTIGNVIMIDNHRARIELSQNSMVPSLTDDSPVTVTIKKEQLTSGLQDITGGGVTVIAIGDYVGTRSKKVFIHYLPWYNDHIAKQGVPAYQGWRDLEHCLPESIVYSNSPLIGEYSQLDEDVLEYHFLSMYAAGIDGLIINLVPSREYEKVIVMKCLNKLKEMNEQYAGSGFNLKFIISYDEKDPSESVEANFMYVRDSLTNNLKFNSFYFYDTETSKPVLITWDQLYPELYHPILKELYNDSVIHLVRGDAEFLLSDGNMEWVNYLDTVNSPVGNTYYWGENYYDNFHRKIAKQDSIVAFKDRNYLCMGAVWPGFDDHNAPWRDNKPEGRWISRNVTEGETLALTFDKLNSLNYIPGALGNIKVEIPWIQVATWNDWPEGTSIEPATSEYYGFTALKTTAIKTAEFKGTSIDTSRVRIPYAIYQARKNNQPETALCLINQLLAGSSYTEAINSCNSGYCKYIPMPAYTQKENDEYSGAACAKMILDLEKSNNISQSDLQTYATTHNSSANIGQPFIDPYGMYRVLNYYGSSGYNYGQLARTNMTEAYNDLCYWISNNIPNVNHSNMPSTVPTGGNFNNWIIVNGFRSSANPHSTGSYTVYGFYVKDPNVSGIGHDIYIQADVFGSEFFKPIASPGIWFNQYVTVDEPPVNDAVVTIQLLQPGYFKPVNDRLRFMAAEEGLRNYGLLTNDGNFIGAMKGASRGRTFFVDLPGYRDDYYIVTFEKNGGCSMAAIIDANNGALKEVSFSESYDKDYYENLTSRSSGLKSTTNGSGHHNAFYPDVEKISLADNINSETGGVTGTGFLIVPNPAIGHAHLIVDYPVQGKIYIEIYNMTGLMIRKIELSEISSNGCFYLDLGGLDDGIYVVSVIHNGERSYKKLIVGD